MADRSPLLTQMDKNTRTVLEDIYQKVERAVSQTKAISRKVPITSNNNEIPQELYSAPNIRTINTIEVVTGTNTVDMADLNTKLQTLAADMETMRIGINSALNAVRQLNK
jgi:hypothetical protein